MLFCRKWIVLFIVSLISEVLLEVVPLHMFMQSEKRHERPRSAAKSYGGRQTKTEAGGRRRFMLARGDLLVPTIYE